MVRCGVVWCDSEVWEAILSEFHWVGIQRVILKKQIKNFDWLDGQKVVTWVLEKLVSQVHQHAGYSLHNEEEEISYKKKKKKMRKKKSHYDIWWQN